MIFLFAVVHLLSQGRDRRYILHVPPRLTSPTALVLVFHGGSDTPENMEKVSDFDALADRERFIVAYPTGIDKTWNDGRGVTEAEKAGVDDVAFVRAMVRDIQSKVRVDPKRIYATGPSNGGIFSNRLGCEAADIFAAIGPVIGTLASNLAPRCHPSQPISVIGIQSTTDPLVPFEGGGMKARGGSIESGPATQALWARIDGCNPRPAVASMPARVNDGTSVTKRTFSGCRAGTEVVWYEVEGGGHRWHGHELPRPMAERVVQKRLGKSSQNIDATQTLWAFFKSHPR